jgi:hypothetical protein
MPRSTGITRSAGRPLVVRHGAPLTGERQQLLIQLLATGLERFLGHANAEPGLWNSGAPGVMYERHPTDEVTHD